MPEMDGVGAKEAKGLLTDLFSAADSGKAASVFPRRQPVITVAHSNPAKVQERANYRSRCWKRAADASAREL
jgi:hypothetical protein